MTDHTDLIEVPPDLWARDRRTLRERAPQMWRPEDGRLRVRPDLAPPEQLSLLSEEQLAAVTDAVAVDRARGHWFAPALNHAVMASLARLDGRGALAMFVAWNLTRMGPARWHDLTVAQICAALDRQPRWVKQMRAKAHEQGWLEIRSGPGGRHRGAVTMPGRFLALHQTGEELAEWDRRHRQLPQPRRAADGQMQLDVAAQVEASLAEAERRRAEAT